MELLAMINERLTAQGWQQKELAFEWQAAVGAGEANTYESRLSNLLNADRGGFEFLADEKKGLPRRRGLASALKLEHQRFEQLFDDEERARTLLLHPHVPTAARAYLERRAARPDAPFRIRAWVGSGVDAREALRNAALKASRALVVIPDARERDFFHGAGLDTTLVEPTDRGFALTGAPDLTAPMPPRLRDADGMPMVPEPELERRYRDSMVTSARRGSGHELTSGERRWVAVIEEADDGCRTPTFRLDWLACAPTAAQLKKAILSWVVAALVPSAKPVDAVADGFLWARDNAVIVIGPRPPRRALVEEHHPVRDADSVTSLVTRLLEVANGLNPYAVGGPMGIDAQLDEVERDIGVRVDISRDELRAVVLPRHPAGSFAELADVRSDIAADTAFHALLDDLLARELAVAPEIVFELQAVRKAPLLHADGPGARSVIANTGAGNVVRLHVQEYVDEPPAPVRTWHGRADYQRQPETVLDGGNVRLRIERSVHRALEGTVLAAPRRWRDVEAANEQSSSWDDDD